MRKEKEVTKNPKKRKIVATRFFLAKLRNIVKFAIASNIGHKWPMHLSEWPGFVVSTVAMIFQILEASRRADSLNLVTTEVGPLFHLFTGQMCLAIESRSRWDHSRFSFVPALYEELKFWYSNIGSFNGYCKLSLGANFKAHRSFCWRHFVNHVKLFIWNCFSVTNLRLVRSMLIRAGTRYFSSAVSASFLCFWSSGSLHHRRVWVRSWTTQ